MKGLKTLSQLAKQQPEYLDVCATATICRLLGRQIKSLRSQVARTACLAAGDIFSSSIRGIDQVKDLKFSISFVMDTLQNKRSILALTYFRFCFVLIIHVFQ